MEKVVTPSEIYLATGINEIDMPLVDRIKDMVDDAEFSYGGSSSCLLACYNGQLFICDGVDPTTGKPITDEILDQIRAEVNWAIVIK